MNKRTGFRLLILLVLIPLLLSQWGPETRAAVGHQPVRSAANAILRQTNAAFLPSIDHCFLYYLDDFSNANSGWPKVESATASFGYLDGEYRILLKNPFWFGGVYTGDTLESYFVTTDVRNVNNREGLYGLLFGHKSWTNFFAYFIDNAGHYSIWDYSNSTWSLFEEGDSPHLNPGSATNRIAIQRTGNWSNVFANGHIIASVWSPTNGGDQRFGVLATSGSQAKLDIRFDNFKVEPPVCGWKAYPGGLVESGDIPKPGEIIPPGWLDKDLPAGLFKEP